MRLLTLSFALAVVPASVGACSASSGDEQTSVTGTWVDRTAGTPAATQIWTGVASDSTGGHLVAVENTEGIDGRGDIWTSTDSGEHWTDRTTGTLASGHTWVSVASDTSGGHLVAVESDGTSGGLWTSSNAGVTWKQSRNFAADLSESLAILSDAMGAHLVLASGDVWTSDDGGVTWTDKTAGTAAAGLSWVSMAGDSTVTHLVGATAYGDLWTSADSGATWINRTKGTAASSQTWAFVASDAKGTHLVAAAQPSVSDAGVLYGADIWTSVDSGSTWTNRTAGTSASGRSWAVVASDATGQHLVAASAHDGLTASGNDIWLSADFGMTWADVTRGSVAGNQLWTAVACNASGAHVVAVAANPGTLDPLVGGDIFTN